MDAQTAVSLLLLQTGTQVVEGADLGRRAASALSKKRQRYRTTMLLFLADRGLIEFRALEANSLPPVSALLMRSASDRDHAWIKKIPRCHGHIFDRL